MLSRVAQRMLTAWLTVLAPQQWTREAAHAVDPGYYVEPEPLEDTDGWLTRVFYKVKKLAQTGDAATLLCLILRSPFGLRPRY